MSNLRVDSLDSDSGYVAFSGGLDSSEATSGLGFARGTTAQRPSGTNGGEVRLNDEKRRIKVLKPEYVDGFLIDHKEIMTYEESSDYISDRLKGTENPRISGV